MTYQTAYKLLVAAYKSAKGIMPEGLDLLKIKQKARQKVIDSKKVIQFPQDKITPFYKPRPRSESEAEMLKRMNRQNKESVARLKEKKEKSLGEKLRDYDGDPDAMKVGGIAKLMSKGIKTALKRTRKAYDTPGADFQVLTQSDSYLMSPPNMQMLEKLKIVRRQLVRDIKRKEGGGKYTFGPDPKATKKDLQLLDEYIADLKDKIKVEGYYGKGAEAEKSLLKSDPLLPFSKLVKDKYRNAEGGIIGYGSGGKVKKPFRSKVVDFLGGPSVVGAELGLSGLLEVYNLLGMPLMKDGGKVRRRKKGEAMDDDGEEPGPKRFPRIPEGEIFLDKMPIPKRSDGIIELATGGMTNISDTYDNNPTLQAQYPNKQDYLDMFAQQTTTTTPQTNTTTQSTTSTIAPINPIKPIIPLPQDSGDSGGITFGKGRTDSNQPNYMGGKEPGIVAALQRTYNNLKDPLITYNPMNPAFLFNVGKAGLEKAREFAKQVQAQKALEEAQEKARLADELARQMNAAYYDNPGADFTGGRYDGASSRSEYESNPTGFSGSS